MALNKCKLGDCIELYDRICGISNLTANDISGINKEKEFFEPSRQVGKDTTNYKIVPVRYFACNLMHVGRDRVLPIAFNHTSKEKCVSPAYTVFRLKENDILLDTYFFMMLKSKERDRYFWFHTDASIRDGMSLADFCDLEFAVPSLQIQRKYVAIYEAMRANQQTYEHGLENLKLTYEAIINEYKHKSPIMCMGDILQEIDHRNVDGKITNVQGINIYKQFMPSVANTNGVNLSKYKLVEKGQLAFSGMQTGRDKCIRIALYGRDEQIIISPAYSVLELYTDKVLAEYVMMWFSREEVDRLGWFMSDASIRTNLDMESFFEIPIPVPPLDIQASIVKIYDVYNARREIGERLKTQLRDICPILIKGAIDEARREAGHGKAKEV